MKLSQRIRAAAEIAGRPLSDHAIALFVSSLAGYDEADVVPALERVVNEGMRLTPGAVISQIPGCHVSAEEAWSIAEAAYDERNTFVWTSAIARSFGQVRHMSDRVAARMAFREIYRRELASEPPGKPRWNVSLGHDVEGRRLPLLDAHEMGRLSDLDVRRLLPAPEAAPKALPRSEPAEDPSGIGGALAWLHA
ncbi:MAG: hypothetical protein KC766_11055, partial [Myxococcales bacterium]|nr:hypothetical protein [Myxococcales bacterium]